jgi:hypothetical protein
MEDIIIDTEIIATNKKKNTTKYICEHGKQKSRCKDCGGSGICKHNKHKAFCKECGGSQICQHNKIKSKCKECGGSELCEHGKQKSNCKECGGSQICEHNKQKSSCKECGGSQICNHNKHKSACKECGGSQLCKHNKQKSRCKECGGTSYCEHNKNRIFCKECGGSQICLHNKIKSNCKECGGSQICEHNKQKSSCKECGGSQICDHNKERSKCKECGGSQICDHNKYKAFCKECGGSQICKHDKLKSDCKECGGSRLCKSEWCEKKKNTKYDNYCLFCYVNLHPDTNISRNHKTKEKHITDRVIQEFPHFSWVTDKKIIDGCSRRRPDMLLDMGSHIIIIEIDEYQHKGYDCSCENKRLMEISQDLNFRPIVFIRFNPDEYIDNNGNKIKSPWKINKLTGLFNIDPKKSADWDSRINSLIEQIKYWTVYHSDKMIEIVQLYF